jgi:predicted methyltransferase
MSHSMSPLAFAAATLVLLGGCAAGPTTRQGTAEALEQIIRGDHRSEANRARDPHRNPKETLLFFGIRPEMHVVEVWPGGGWYTEIIAPLVNERGRYYAAHYAPNPESRFISNALQAYQEKLQSRPGLYGNVVVTTLSPKGEDIAPPGSADLVVTFRNIHNWMANDWAPTAFESMYRALKPGGILGVVEHRGNPEVPQDPKARSGYVNEDYAVKLIESVGFRLVAKSEVNANPRDTRNYEQGVWTLPPTFRMGDTDREKYAEIGESDRFTLRFVKPRN